MKIVYIRAVEMGELSSVQKLIRLPANNTDGIKPFYTDPQHVIGLEELVRKDQEHKVKIKKVVGTDPRNHAFMERSR